MLRDEYDQRRGEDGEQEREKRAHEAMRSAQNYGSSGILSGHTSKRYYSYGNNKKLYDEARLATSDDDLMKKIVIKNFKNIKDESPNVIDIDNETGEVRQISKDHDRLNFKNFSQQ